MSDPELPGHDSSRLGELWVRRRSIPFPPDPDGRTMRLAIVEGMIAGLVSRYVENNGTPLARVDWEPVLDRELRWASQGIHELLDAADDVTRPYIEATALVADELSELRRKGD